MKVYKRTPTGAYWYQFKFRGERIRKSSGVFNKQDAYDIAVAARTARVKAEVGIEAPKAPEPAPVIPTFSAAMKDFLEWSEQEYQAHPASHRRYVTSSKALLHHFNDTAIDKITSDDVERFKTSRARQRKAPAGKKSKHRPSKKDASRIKPATVNRELALLHHMFTRFDNLVPRNPVSKVKKLEENNQQDRVLTREEEKLYLMAASQPLQDIAVLMLETGMRPEEVCRIRRENVFLEDGYLFNPFGKTKSARRRIPLNDTASAVLFRRLVAVKGEYIFPGRVDGKPIVKVNAAHTSAVKRSKVARFKLYDLRHTWATRAAQAGVDVATLAAMLGHSRLAMVLRYVHPTQEHQFAAMRKIQAAR